MSVEVIQIKKKHKYINPIKFPEENDAFQSPRHPSPAADHHGERRQCAGHSVVPTRNGHRASQTSVHDAADIKEFH